jgi:hypothetical protein
MGFTLDGVLYFVKYRINRFDKDVIEQESYFEYIAYLFFATTAL